MPDGDRRPFPYLPLPGAEEAGKSNRQTRGLKIRYWGHDRQIERVRPQLQRLQEAIERRRLELRGELAGVEPELALVIETAGTIDRFYKAVRRIPGLEWLAEEDEPEMPAGDDFRPERKGEKPVGGTVYLVMSDRQALGELLSMWRRYEKDENLQLPRGLTPWRHAFKNVRTIRPWGPEDRLRETGLIEDWKDRLEWGAPTVRAQVELWYREGERRRESQVRELEVRLRRAGGRILGQSVVIPEIGYHACIAEVPRERAAEIVAGEEVELLRCEGVMFLRPVAQFATPLGTEEAAAGLEGAIGGPPPDREPVVAVLDGLPLEGHELLRDRLRIDDPDGWAAEVPAAQRRHGTAMASLVVHGDLGETSGQAPLPRPVYARPLLRPVQVGPSESKEAIPEDALEVDLVHRAVRRMLEGEEDNEPAAPGILIVNLSLGDPSRPFEQQVSPLARLLDWLAWEKAVLFVVSAGNPPSARRLRIACSREELRQLDPTALRKLTWEAIVREAHLRRLLAPAESINALTIGGERADGAGRCEIRDRIDPLGEDDGARLPSPATALGVGVRRSIKPDLYYPAGRQLYRDSYSSADSGVALEQASVPAHPPGQRVASSGGAGAPGRTDRTSYACGTSNAAALTSRAAAQLYERLPELLAGEPLGLLPDRRFLVPLLKALLVHGASWGSSQDLLRELLTDPLDRNPSRMELGRYLGYGFPDGDRLLGCHDQRATLCGWGELGDGEGHVFRIPLPLGLSGKHLWRRLTITLAWLSPINPRDKRYRRAQLWFEPKAEAEEEDSTSLLQVGRREADHSAAMRGTV